MSAPITAATSARRAADGDQRLPVALVWRSRRNASGRRSHAFDPGHHAGIGLPGGGVIIKDGFTMRGISTAACCASSATRDPRFPVYIF
jgi:hypothetical protein